MKDDKKIMQQMITDHFVQVEKKFTTDELQAIVKTVELVGEYILSKEALKELLVFTNKVHPFTHLATIKLDDVYPKIDNLTSLDLISISQKALK